MVNLGVPPSKLNPAALICTCKGFRGFNLCSHVIAVTATELNDDDCCEGYSTYDEVYLEKLIQKLNTKKWASHRPRNVVPGQRVQPDDDMVDDSEEDEEDLDEDLDLV